MTENPEGVSPEHEIALEKRIYEALYDAQVLLFALNHIRDLRESPRLTLWDFFDDSDVFDVANLMVAVDIDLERRGGEPVLKGTRMPVWQILSALANGGTLEYLHDEYCLEPRDVKRLLNVLASEFARPFTGLDIPGNAGSPHNADSGPTASR